MESKRIRIMAGPNGSGKSTILKEVRNNFYSGPFVNADEIEKSFREKGLVNIPADYLIDVRSSAFDKYMKAFGNSWISKSIAEGTQITVQCEESILLTIGKPTPYDAAIAADFIRQQLLEQDQTFTFETVMSHPSKISFLREAVERGYKNYLYFICTVSPQVNIDRIMQRVKLGGHAVPDDKVRKRYRESLEVLTQLIPHCYRCYFFDNSSELPSIKPIATIDSQKQFQITTSNIPWWLQEYVIDQLYA